MALRLTARIRHCGCAPQTLGSAKRPSGDSVARSVLQHRFRQQLELTVKRGPIPYDRRGRKVQRRVHALLLDCLVGPAAYRRSPASHARETTLVAGRAIVRLMVHFLPSSARLCTGAPDIVRAAGTQTWCAEPLSDCGAWGFAWQSTISGRSHRRPRSGLERRVRLLIASGAGGTSGPSGKSRAH